VPSTCGRGASVQHPRGRRRHNATKRSLVHSGTMPSSWRLAGTSSMAAPRTRHDANGRRAKNPARHAGALHVAIRPVPLRRLPHRDERRPGSSQTCAAASPRRIARTVAPRQSSNYCYYRRHLPGLVDRGMANRRSERRDAKLPLGACWSWATPALRQCQAAATLSSVDVEVGAGVYPRSRSSSASRWSPSLPWRHAASIDLPPANVGEP
jgi:hypothetical protein